MSTHEIIRNARKRASASQIRKKVGESSTSGILEALGGSTGPDAFSSYNEEIKVEENPAADIVGEMSIQESVQNAEDEGDA